MAGIGRGYGHLTEYVALDNSIFNTVYMCQRERYVYVQRSYIV